MSQEAKIVPLSSVPTDQVGKKKATHQELVDKYKAILLAPKKKKTA